MHPASVRVLTTLRFRSMISLLNQDSIAGFLYRGTKSIAGRSQLTDKSNAIQSNGLTVFQPAPSRIIQ